MVKKELLRPQPVDKRSWRTTSCYSDKLGKFRIADPLLCEAEILANLIEERCRNYRKRTQPPIYLWLASCEQSDGGAHALTIISRP